MAVWFWPWGVRMSGHSGLLKMKRLLFHRGSLKPRGGFWLVQNVPTCWHTSRFLLRSFQVLRAVHRIVFIPFVHFWKPNLWEADTNLVAELGLICMYWDWELKCSFEVLSSSPFMRKCEICHTSVSETNWFQFYVLLEFISLMFSFGIPEAVQEGFSKCV